jgi:uncharacterized protein YkwD
MKKKILLILILLLVILICTLYTLSNSTKRLSQSSVFIVTQKFYNNGGNVLPEDAHSDVKVINNKPTLIINKAPDVPSDGYRKEIFLLVNQYRRQENIPELQYSFKLEAVAQVRSDEMLLHKYFEHIRPDGRKWSTAYNELNVTYNRAAENLARGFNSAEAAMKAWMKSESHRRNILNPNLKFIGIGVSSNEVDTYFTQEFTG